MKKLALIIMDGVGINPKDKGNAVKQAKTPNLDKLFNAYPHIELGASEEAVGLPKGQVGNSEVGHLNIGAGRVVYTGLQIINNDLATHKFYQNEAFIGAVNHSRKFHSKIHLIGLVSNGGVHSSWEHLLGLINFLKINNVNNWVLHIFADGRDVHQQSLLADVEKLEPLVEEAHGKIGSVCGRFYALDRDKNWDREEKSYACLLGTCLNTFKNLQQYIQTQYDEKIYDEFLTPAINGNYSSEQIGISNNDAIIFFNFRPDRARQLSHILIGSEIYDYQPKTRKTNLYFVTMMNYEGIKPSAIAYPPHLISNVLGEILEKNNLRQLRIAETEKYAHVTFFFDGGLEQNFNGEIKTIINSPKVLTYDLAPEMSAYQITDELISQMESNDVIICNFANGDMVGHTGNLEATIKAVEIVDECIGKIYDAAQKNDYVLFITADHGNADVMLDDNDEVITSHSINNVPFLITDNHVSFTTNRGILGNIAPSILAYLGIAKPNDMLPSIIKINK